jgi:hypothetical protein
MSGGSGMSAGSGSLLMNGSDLSAHCSLHVLYVGVGLLNGAFDMVDALMIRQEVAPDEGNNSMEGIEDGQFPLPAHLRHESMRTT